MSGGAGRWAAVFIAATLVAGACSSGDDTTAPVDPRSAAAPPTIRTDARLRLSVAPGPGGAVMTVRVTPPAGATEMQVGVDPTFTTVEWQPVSRRVSFEVDGGYQEVFARFRDTPDDATPLTVVAGTDVDLAAAAATTDPPTPTAIGLATPTVLTVDIEVGRVDRGTGDDGDRLRGADVDPTELDRGWRITTSQGDAPTITSTRRDTRPTDTGHTADDDLVFPLRHRISLTLSEPVVIGRAYELRSPLGGRTPFTIDDRATPSPAVHVNQVGFRPSDTAKIAYLTADRATTAFDPPPAFHVVDRDGAVVFDGVAVPQSPRAGGELGAGDLTGLDVWALDFSALVTPGRDRVCVDGVGCSASFSIDEDTTWMRAAVTVARGLFHQRSGIALGQPNTAIARPRPDHPDDGLTVHQSSLTALEASELPDDQVFARLVAGASKEVVPDAWGGHFDAGDWDRRAQHLWMVRSLLDTLRIAPDRFAKLDLDLPESGDAIPDLLDEALWTLDLFRRLQRPDGAVRGGIESARFPERGVASWTDDLARFAYAPDPWSTYAYAAAAADASRALAPYDATRAQEFATSATAAMTWADAQTPSSKDADKVRAQRGVAAAAMLGLTGDPRYEQAFRDATPFDEGPQDVLGCNAAEICESAWEYLWAAPSATDPTTVANIVESYRRAAARSADAADTTRFGWCLEDPDVPLIWGLGVGGAPRAVTLLRAWLLTGDARDRAAAERCASVSLGGNPLDVSYVTGLGANPTRHPLIVDVNDAGLPAWPGTPVYGNQRPEGDTTWIIDDRLRPAGATGDPAKVPYLLSWYDLADVGPMNEFTVYQSHGPAIWVFGVLASAAPVAPPR